MTSRLRPSFTAAVLAAAVLLTLVVPAVDARAPGATRYRADGPITLDTNLLSRSGASVWAIDAYLEAKTPLPPLGAAFIRAERKYRVNARFLLAAALHESGWGTSAISRVKHNLFGYNAYDRDPFRYATAYATYAANIDATAKFIKDFYLTPGGRWWGGAPTLRSMQCFWSSSGRWGEGVSRIATSIHLDSIARRSITFATPVVSGTLHGASLATVRLAWKGGALPRGIEFVARWIPVELDAEDAADPSGPTSIVAKRVRTGSRSITLAVVAPRAPGSYVLNVELRDTGRGALPAGDRVAIPGVDVQVWGDRAVSFDLEPSDGEGAVLRITNTGRETIPATPEQVSSEPQDPDSQPARSVVTVTASAFEPGNPVSVQLIAAPLRADLAPGASVAINVPRLHAATGRATNWLAVTLSVLGDATWLPASSAFGAWVSDPTAGAPPSPTILAPLPSSKATPSPTPSTTPIPKATPRPSPNPTPTPRATPSPKPTIAARPAPARITKTYSEHSRAITYRGGWGAAPNRGYIGGRVAWSKSPGATATFTFTGSSVSWIGPKGPTRGVALVLLDGRAVARVDLWRSSFVARAVLFKRTFHATGRHTLTIRVLSTPSHPCVAIDGFVVRS